MKKLDVVGSTERGKDKKKVKVGKAGCLYSVVHKTKNKAKLTIDFKLYVTRGVWESGVFRLYVTRGVWASGVFGLYVTRGVWASGVFGLYVTRGVWASGVFGAICYPWVLGRSRVFRYRAGKLNQWRLSTKNMEIVFTSFSRI